MDDEVAGPVAVVGIGSSAGGLEALRAMLHGTPPDTGMAFVVVTHQARGHVSALPEILARATRMPVEDATHGLRIAPNHVYVCPPDNVLTVADRELRLQPRDAEVQRRPVDVFLSSLAEASKERAIGIVLSGGGSDGTLGLKAIKEAGGLTIAQGSDGTAPLHTGMPDTAIASGVVDLTLSTEDIGPRLATLAAQLKAPAVIARQPEIDDVRRAICQLLLKQVGHDFSGYKENTFMRRVRRRMQVRQLVELGAYLDRLRADTEEVTLLFRDLLIGVTTFFRDPDAFETLQKQVIPQIFEGKGAGDTVRVWVPGCATGEEVYSIAILLREFLDTLPAAPKAQVFATDIDEAALTVARTGRYPAQIMDHVSPERLRKYFTGDDATHVVNKEIRDMCMFSPHSVLRDPPFSRVDLVSCRNLLIYFGVEFQAKALPVFHFALRPGMFLFLGTSENISQAGELFTPIDRRHRIFRRRDNVFNPLQFGNYAPPPRSFTEAGFRSEPLAMATAVRRAVEARVIERFAAAHVVVNREGDVVHYSGRTGKYLEPAAGLPNRQLVGMARRGLRLELRAALRDAVEGRRSVERASIQVELEDRVQIIDLTVEPFGDSTADPLFLVVFQDVGQPHLPAATRVRDSPQEEIETGTVDRLEIELRETRERLQATIEEYETAVEELKSSNEELQSINEELQSANEELETSKEELQSVNEELQTVNAELNTKIEEVDRANADLRNVFDSTEIATIFLDRHLMIRSFTPAVSSIFNLISGDRGRPLTDIVSLVTELGGLRGDVAGVLASGEALERRVKRTDGSGHYLMRVMPYRGPRDAVDGVLITFIDVTKMIEAEQHQRMLVDELNHRVRNMLTVVGAIAKQTLGQSKGNKQVTEDFLGRLNSLARSYTLVSRENWGSVPLAEIFADELRAYEKRVDVSGPSVACRPTAALALGLVAHELTTNAQKYGSLSNDEGRLRVTWEIDRTGEWLSIKWHEMGGPAVARRHEAGFGSKLITRQLGSFLDATFDLDFREDGLVVTFRTPLHGNNFIIERREAAQ